MYATGTFFNLSRKFAVRLVNILMIDWLIRPCWLFNWFLYLGLF